MLFYVAFCLEIFRQIVYNKKNVIIWISLCPRQGGFSMSKKKKIAVSVLSVILVLAVAVGAVVFAGYKKEYTVKEKNGLSMGSIVAIKLYGDDTFKKLDVVKKLIDNLDKEISAKIDSSAVSSLNKNGEVKSATVSDILLKCRKVSELSDGAFDLSIGTLSSLWDFDDDVKKIPSKQEIQKALSAVDYEKIAINGSNIGTGKNQLIDLGAVGKGAACDAVKAYLEKSGVKGAVVSVGGSILAYGSRNKIGDKWHVAVRHPRKENEYIGIISLSEGFVSTSGDYEKYFEKDGKRYHHILDANTGYPAESGLISVTVVCNSGTLSDALSTACFILGEEKSKALLDEYSAAAVFVDENLNVTTYGDVDFEPIK